MIKSDSHVPARTASPSNFHQAIDEGKPVLVLVQRALNKEGLEVARREVRLDAPVAPKQAIEKEVDKFRLFVTQTSGDTEISIQNELRVSRESLNESIDHLKLAKSVYEVQVAVRRASSLATYIAGLTNLAVSK